MSAPRQIDMVRLAATKLSGLKDEVAFLGGAIVGLLVTDPAAREARATLDVDVILEVGSRLEYHQFEEKLRALGFANVFEGPICRFQHGETILDVMPTAEEILGFSNRWYASALSSATWQSLGDNVSARVIDAPHFLATKLEAFASTTREYFGDYVMSRDFEDIVTVVDGRSTIVEEIRRAPAAVREFVGLALEEYLKDERLAEGVSAHLEIDAATQARSKLVLDRFQEMVNPGESSNA